MESETVAYDTEISEQLRMLTEQIHSSCCWRWKFAQDYRDNASFRSTAPYSIEESMQ